jgi:hypothetical protein
VAGATIVLVDATMLYQTKHRRPAPWPSTRSCSRSTAPDRRPDRSWRPLIGCDNGRGTAVVPVVVGRRFSIRPMAASIG